MRERTFRHPLPLIRTATAWSGVFLDPYRDREGADGYRGKVTRSPDASPPSPEGDRRRVATRSPSNRASMQLLDAKEIKLGDHLLPFVDGRSRKFPVVDDAQVHSAHLRGIVIEQGDNGVRVATRHRHLFVDLTFHSGEIRLA